MTEQTQTPPAATPATPQAAPEAAARPAREGSRDSNREGGRERRDGGNRERRDDDRAGSEMVDKLIGVRRVAKTVKGGRRMAFGALVVIGDEAGRVGYGKGKAREVPDAVRKATDEAKRGMVRVPLRQGRTIHHEVRGRFGSTRVVLKPGVPGTGIVAGGPMRAIFEAMGIKDIVAKALGSTNPYNMVKATFAAFALMETPRGIAAKRGLKITDLILHAGEAKRGETDQKELNEAQLKAKEARKASQAAKSKGGRSDRRDDKGRGPRRDGAAGEGRGPRGEGRAESREGGRDRKAESPKVVTVTKGQSMKAAVTEQPASDAASPAAATENKSE